MLFDENNKIVKLCTMGMEFEAKGNRKAAHKLFQQAWDESENDLERFTSAHYLARHQDTVRDKLNWDIKALEYALQIKDDNVLGSYSSLYLNIAKGYEDLNDFENAKENYELALSYANHLAKDGYGNMIKGGILKGIERMKGNMDQK